MQDYENLSPSAQKKDPHEKSEFALFMEYLRSFITPIVVGIVLSGILFVYFPLVIHFHMTALDWKYSIIYASNEFSLRLKYLMHGDFSRYQDWGFPLMGAGVAVCLKLLYEQE